MIYWHFDAIMFYLNLCIFISLSLLNFIDLINNIVWNFYLAFCLIFLGFLTNQALNLGVPWYMYIFHFTYRFSWNNRYWVSLLPLCERCLCESFNAYDSFLMMSDSRIVVPMFLLSTSVKLVSLLSSVCAGLLAIGFSIIPNCPYQILS